VNCEIK